jgi:hypothetical protein
LVQGGERRCTVSKLKYFRCGDYIANMYVVHKKVGKRRYAYLQRSYRVGGKVKTKSRYLGPVDVAMAALSGVVFTNPPGRRARAADYRKSDTDARRVKMGTGKTLEEEAWDLRHKDTRTLRPRDRAIRDAWTRKQSAMSQEEWDRHMAWAKAQHAADRAANEASRAEPAQRSEQSPSDDEEAGS